MLPDIQHYVLLYHKPMTDDPNHRYLSWEHCYLYFRRRLMTGGRFELETASLHLAFYLASWGMYRGSSFLLQKDYRVHLPVINELVSAQYEQLWNLDLSTADEPEIELLFNLVGRIESAYRSNITLVDGFRRAVVPSATLLTKILLGTLGCVPAYDRYVIAGLARAGVKPCQFGKASIRSLIRFYREHALDLNPIDLRTQEGNLKYPTMKLLDMYLWNIGSTLPDDGQEREPI